MCEDVWVTHISPSRIRNLTMNNIKYQILVTSVNPLYALQRLLRSGLIPISALYTTDHLHQTIAVIKNKG